jgi:hypothetical protein
MAAYKYIEETGVIVPDTSDLLIEVENEFKAVFGQDLVVTPDTPQGALIAAEVLARDTVVRNNAALANQINPNEAGGVFFDGLWALTGGQREKEAFSIVPVNLTGVTGTFIPAGVTMRSDNGDLFASVGDVTLTGISGAATVDFQAVASGPIAAPAGTLNTIVGGVLGWETGVNPVDAVLGRATQSDQSAKTERRVTLALQSSGLAEAMISALYATQNVKSLQFRENDLSIPKLVDGITLAPNSLYVCIDGGTDVDVATTMRQRKGGGCGYNNGFGTPVTVILTDPFSGQLCTIKFDRPLLKPVRARVTVRATNAVSNIEAAVKKAILDYAAGLINTEAGFFVGRPVSCFELGGAINQVEPDLYVQNVEISLLTPVIYSNAEIPVAIYQKATITDSAITVVII